MSDVTSYKRVVNTLLQTIESGFEDVFADNVDRIENNVNIVHKRFFRRLVMKTIGKGSAPNLGEFTPAWLPLSKDYADQKRADGYSTGFFQRTGELKKTLGALNAKSILGTPVVLFSPSGFAGESGVKTVEERWKGQSSKRRVIRDERGRFRSIADIPRFVKASIRIDPYPKIIEDITNEILDEGDYLPDDVAKKLKAPKGSRKRPLFTNFLNWFLNVEIAKAIKI